MPINILMPALSPTMTEGKLAKWLKKEGDSVASGDVLAEIETDKATMEVEAVDEGVLGKILIEAGSEGIAVNTPIAILLEEGEDASALSKAPEAKPAPAAAAPAASPEPTPATAPDTSQLAISKGARIFASPLARRIAKDAGLDLGAITGSGPHGRIIKADVEAAIAAGTGKAKPQEAPAPAKEVAPAKAAPPPSANYIEVPNSTMRKVIAQRLAQSKREAPHFYLSVDWNIDALLKIREELNSRTPEGDAAFKISVNDFVVRAVALAMRAFPDVNCSWTDEAIRYYQTVDVSVAVATPSGLITPVVRNADQKGLATISNEVRLLAKRARDGKLMPEEYQGGGFTISNLGMYGITNFAAVINPPQSCLLAVGAAEKRPIVKDNALAIATMMSCTLSIDHRTVDGAKGAEFLQVLKQLVEDPLRMML